MEIPYIVTPRKDTGLINSKIAIWLFLASEVMLFGGFFSAYVYLRMGADYPWPERTLPVLPGLINTFVLIGSSVTVVFAWAALKMREWRKFQIYMGITVACAALFMVLKGVEYNVKFHHQAVRLDDYSVVEGHLGYELKEGADAHHPNADDYVKDHNGDKIEENMIRVKVEKLTFATKRYYAEWVDEMLSEADHANAKITLEADIEATTTEGGKMKVIAKKGEPLSLDLLKKLKDVQLAALKHNAALRTQNLREQWVVAKDANPGKQGWEISDDVSINMDDITPLMLSEVPSATFVVNPPTEFLFKPRDIREAEGSSRLRDDTVVVGELEESPMVFHNVDAVDFQWLVMKAEEKGISPEAAIENSWLMKNNAFVREIWAWHLKRNEAKQKDLNEQYGFKEDENGKPTETPDRVLTHKELYRIGWKEFRDYGEETKGVEVSAVAGLKEEFMGPNYKARGAETFPELSLPREEIRHAAKFSPAWNTYYAIYFTITGLHGLHVIGGALVLAYYLFFGRKMYLENPEWLANRVEVGGLFWHFVDLIWIFAFPILYLM
ncbi:MAG: cytochrome c oxidase subunit 3 [Akkermansiaceae bacterium]|jgi:heme/copper-type cytochrome/quinol oxidase subunit 3|nr:cytochrome c oxidase subunit 3 [Akkermansiaceae bacterium]MDP4647512.1 cytochrome c oxidase subunit 3 [Akkermansiaceae bacterium]MDP4722457.1 cytochrome c oxidase subunit 3 [Akkermansiaceae bacterium]MDP4778623.1 cytochrome c oxidase subunit 3 [Akkermansiaceae bacterium]MDP4848328.1 cytochrome c oxidase subunit 3 [Akkermansiaceae bacterium]